RRSTQEAQANARPGAEFAGVEPRAGCPARYEPRRRSQAMKQIAYVGLGSNLGHPRRRLARALAQLARLPRSRLVAASPNYVSAPMDCTEPQPDYVNAVAELRTALTPSALLERMRAIERRQGRRRQGSTRRNAPRVLDLDLLLFGRRRLSRPRLSLPHPRMHERAFVLRPL